MKRILMTLTVSAFLFVGTACGDADEPTVGESPEPIEKDVRTTEIGSPIRINYRIIGTPVVGQPLSIDLHVESGVAERPVTLSYRVNDTTALEFPSTQALSVSASPNAQKQFVPQQVMIIPKREGRLYLNVSATMQINGGSVSTVTAVPIQVGTAQRRPQSNGELTTDENGSPLRVLSSD